MRNTEEITLIGYVYQDASHPNEADYPTWVRFKLCVNKKYKSKSGEEKKESTWYECKTNNEKTSKLVKDFVKDKCGILVKGIPKAKAYINKDGKAEGSIEVIITEFNVLVRPLEGGNYNQSSDMEDKFSGNIKTIDDEIPF